MEAERGVVTEEADGPTNWSGPDGTEGEPGQLEEEPIPASPILEAIRAKRAAHAAVHIYDLDVPGYDGLLAIRMGPIGGRALTQIRERLEKSKSPDREMNVNLDAIISGCREVLGRQHVDDELVPLDDEEPVKIDRRLGRMLTMPPTTSAREVLLELFRGANDPDLAVGVAAGEYLEWCASANGTIDEEVLGE